MKVKICEKRRCILGKLISETNRKFREAMDTGISGLLREKDRVKHAACQKFP